MKQQIIYFLNCLIMMLTLEVSAADFESLKATLSRWESCATEIHSALIAQDDTRIQSHIGELRNILVDAPSLQANIQSMVQQWDMKPELKTEFLKRVEGQLEFLRDLGRQAEMMLPLILRKKALIQERERLSNQRESAWQRYKELNDQDNAHEREINGRIAESWEWKTFGKIAPRFKEELSYVGHIGRPFKDHPGNAALIAADHAYYNLKGSIEPQIASLETQIKTVVPSMEPISQLYGVLQKQARILDGMLVVIEGGGGLAGALVKTGEVVQSLSGVEDVFMDSVSERAARSVLEMVSRDSSLFQPGSINSKTLEAMRTKVFEGMDPLVIDAERADMLIAQHFLRMKEGAPWSLETLKPFVKTLFTEAIRRPKM